MSPVTRKNSGSGRVFRYDYRTAGIGPSRWGLFVMIPFLLLLAAWASYAPLSAAAIADGAVVLDHDRKTVQHLEGGIIEDVLIAEGETVTHGQSILVLRDVKQRAQLDTLKFQLASARALKSRLVAERNETSELDFSSLETDIDLADETFASLRQLQTRLWKSRAKAIQTKIDLIEANKSAIVKQIDGLNHQIRSASTRRDLVATEREAVLSLHKKKLTTNNRLMELNRNAARLEGEVGMLTAYIGQLEREISAADIEIIDLRTEFQSRILQELQTVSLRIQDLEHQMTATKDLLARTIIRAPANGIVLDLQVQSRGAVVGPGQRLLEIVPEEDRLIVEARLKPNDIDLVTTGTPAKVQLSAYKARKIPKLDGTVLSVSADVIADPSTGERYFKARVLVSDKMMDELKADIALHPGMQAQVFFLAGERTVADYLLSPITDATYRAFRED
ncbi:HlyD family type I secretion periplasmic adaptor subunit [Roseibium sp. HPY-6]|uniref:HlyD family type I secretion periplasmic adaptor subunit n=1 Tax=Roseibium sp. HPY-6 TaxID=3229852 RepID=UPI00338FDD28